MKSASRIPGQELTRLKKRLERGTKRREMAETSLKSGKEHSVKLVHRFALDVESAPGKGTLARGTIPSNRKKV